MEWKEYKLGEIAYCDLGKMLDQKKNTGNPQIYLNNIAVRWGAFDVNREQTMLFEEKDAERYQIKKGDIVVCEGGEPGRCAIWNEDYPIYYQKALHRVRTKEPHNNIYLYYHLRHLFQSGLANNFTTGTTIKHLPREVLLKIPVRLPELDVQKKVASILSSLDRKIELNNQINKQLEEMAQAIFKSWFIDFEPFKDGEFVDSELGRIPKGWRVDTLGSICEIEKKSINPQKTPNVVYSHYSLPAFDAGKLPVKQKGNEIMSNKYQFCEDTILLSKLNPNIKRIWYVKDLEENAICSTEFIPLKPKVSYFLPFLLATLNNDSFYSKLLGGVSGATNSHQRLTPDDVLKLPIAYDPETVGWYFEATNEMLAKMNGNIKQIRELSSLRDTLLPKLMSGEINLEQYGNQ